MPYQNIAATITTEDLTAIKDAIATIRAKLPFLVTLTAEERRRLYKMADKSLAFVTNSLTAAEANAQILPTSFDLPGFAQDVKLAAVLTEILMPLGQVKEEVEDTLMAVGSEAMASSLTVYDYVKTAAKTQPGLKSVAEQLGERFKASKVKRLDDPDES